MFKFFKKIRVIVRLNHIIFVFFKAGFAGVISAYGFKKHINPLKKFRGKEEEEELVLALNFRLALESLGPVFVKFGQILSTRSDFLPKSFIKQLEKLQAKVPPFAYEKAVEIIEREFEKPLTKLFKKFDEKPFASASLGQVYKAQLHTGEIVAIKVQRPKAKEQIMLDTEVLLTLAHLAEKYSVEAKNFNIMETVQEFRRWTLNELDYRKEATNCEIFSNFFKKDKNIYGPKVFWDYSSSSVLCLEFVEGKQLSEVIKDGEYPQNEKTLLARHIADAFIRQFFEYGYFHAD
jgi:ubiquinone biosynthesis protein